MAFATQHYGESSGFGSNGKDKIRGAVIAACLQGAGIAALLLIPTAIIVDDTPDKRVKLIDITPDPVKPPPPAPKPIEKVVDTPPDTTLTAPKPIFETPQIFDDVGPTIIDKPVPYTPIIGTGDDILGGAGGEVAPVFIPTPEPLLVKPKLDQKYARQFQPNFPTGKLRAGIEGKVTVRVLVGTNGRAKAIEQVSATDPAFYRATERHALRKWRFTPATSDGKPVEQWMTVSVNFTISER
jgi:protein TonB